MLADKNIREAYLILTDEKNNTNLNYSGLADKDNLEVFTTNLESAPSVRAMVNNIPTTPVYLTKDLNAEKLDKLLDHLRKTNFTPDAIIAFALWDQNEFSEIRAAMVLTTEKIFTIDGASLPGWKGLTLDGELIVEVNEKTVILDKEWFFSDKKRLKQPIAFVRPERKKL